MTNLIVNFERNVAFFEYDSSSTSSTLPDLRRCSRSSSISVSPALTYFRYILLRLPLGIEVYSSLAQSLAHFQRQSAARTS